MNIDTLADSFVRGHLKRNPGLKVMSITCAVDKRQHLAATREDIHAFLKTLDQDQSIRFDVSDAEVPDELVHAQPEPDVLSADLDLDTDIDLDAPAQPVILVHKRGRGLYYFCGVHQRSKRLVWSTQPHLAHKFQGESELINTVFGFKDDQNLVLKESFESLQLMALAPPPEPSF